MPGLPQFVEPLRLAETGEQVAGTIPVEGMQRLRDLLHDSGGTIEFELRFSKDDQGLALIEGRFSTALTVVCQRCLEPLALRLARPIEVAVVSGSDQAARLPGEVEPLTLPDGRLHLAGFIEDEIMLAMPMAPRHVPGCPGGRPAGKAEEKAAANRPFAALKDFHPGKA